MEYHDAAGAPSTWIPVKDKETYDIPLRTLISVDTPNLYAAGRAADGDKYASAKPRMDPNWRRLDRPDTQKALIAG